MKKIFFAILISLISLPMFSFGIIADAYFGQSNGADIGVVFGKGKVLTSLGLTVDSHTIIYTDSPSHNSSSSSSSSYNNSYSNYNNKLKTKVESAQDIGPFARLDWVLNFLSFGNIKMGVDVGAQAALTFNSYSDIDLIVSAFPMVNASIGNFNIFTGYKGSFYVADSTNSGFKSSPYTNAFIFGATYRFGKGKEKGTTSIAGIDTSSNPAVIILPNANYKTE